MKKIITLIISIFLLFSCWNNNKTKKEIVEEKNKILLDKILSDKDYLEYSLTFNEKKELSEIGLWVEFFNYKKIYFGNDKKNINIKVNKKTEKIISKVLNEFDYNYIHLWHKLDLEYVNNFPNLLDKKIDKEIYFIIDPKYLNEIFIKNINNSNFKKVYLFLNPITCWKKYSISEKVTKELIKSKNILSFDNDRCWDNYIYENEKLFDKYIRRN